VGPREHLIKAEINETNNEERKTNRAHGEYSIGDYRRRGCSRAVSFEQVAPTAQEMAQRIAAVIAQRPWIVLEGASGPSKARSGRASASAGGAPRASEEDDACVIGYAYASPHNERAAYRWSVSTAIYIDGSHHRRGAGRALYTTLFALLRQLGYRQATAGITLPNPASVGLHTAFGFAPVGVYRQVGYKLGAWRDVAWYQASIQPLPPEPLEPRAIATLHGTAEWDDAVKRGVAHYLAPH
jgi:L-amino acid N-acyltransferase YncA